jgi:AAA domain
MIKLSSSKKATKHVRCLVYGESGAGKTPLGATAPNPIFINSDDGLLSISDLNIPTLDVFDLDDVKEAISFLKSKKGRKFDTVVVDDFTKITKFILDELEEELDDKWEIYGKLGKTGVKVIEKFQSLPMNLVVICKLHEKEDDGVVLRRPKVPGRMLPEELPYMFDEVFALRTKGEGDDENSRFVLTDKTPKWQAKDRSGKLKKFEKPNLTDIFNKIRKGKKIKEKKRK